jgi:hypothetical protein
MHGGFSVSDKIGSRNADCSERLETPNHPNDAVGFCRHFPATRNGEVKPLANPFQSETEQRDAFFVCSSDCSALSL